MNKLIEENLMAVLKREGLEPKAGRFGAVFEDHRALHGKFEAACTR